LLVRNHQRTCVIDVPLLRQISRELLLELCPHQEYELGVHLVNEREMVRLNETFLRHQGCTDVIAFNYHDASDPKLLRGEIFVCVDEALVQARRFRTSWQSEVVRCLVHGMLHLSGYDDRRRLARQKMKRAENSVLKGLAGRFVLTQLGHARVRASQIRNPKAEGRKKSEFRGPKSERKQKAPRHS
jgi:rRNA maturation RNase YbeY